MYRREPMSCAASVDGFNDLALDLIFTDPPRPPSPSPTWEVFETKRSNADKESVRSESLSEIQIRLVGTHPLWGHYLWNAAREFASYLDAHPLLYRGRRILELGAGGGLPGIFAARNGARQVVLTDYPDPDLISNLEYNVLHNIGADMRSHVSVLGYIWGRPVLPLLESLAKEDPHSERGFDLIILSDLIFNHSQHDALLMTCELVLARAPSESRLKENEPGSATSQNSSPTPSVLVFYTHHRPHLAHRDLEFFAKAQKRGWTCEEIIQQKYPPMFPDDPGEEEVRSTVHGWRLCLM